MQRRLTKLVHRSASFTSLLITNEITNDMERRTITMFAEFAVADSGE
jgi:hypothetical protein